MLSLLPPRSSSSGEASQQAVWLTRLKTLTIRSFAGEVSPPLLSAQRLPPCCQNGLSRTARFASQGAAHTVFKPLGVCAQTSSTALSEDSSDRDLRGRAAPLLCHAQSGETRLNFGSFKPKKEDCGLCRIWKAPPTCPKLGPPDHFLHRMYDRRCPGHSSWESG